MQQFYTNTIESKFIKDLIATTPLPTIDTLYKGKWIVPGCYYITDCNVVKANHIAVDENNNIVVTNIANKKPILPIVFFISFINIFTNFT